MTGCWANSLFLFPLFLRALPVSYSFVEKESQGDEMMISSTSSPAPVCWLLRYICSFISWWSVAAVYLHGFFFFFFLTLPFKMFRVPEDLDRTGHLALSVVFLFCVCMSFFFCCFVWGWCAFKIVFLFLSVCMQHCCTRRYHKFTFCTHDKTYVI